MIKWLKNLFNERPEPEPEPEKPEYRIVLKFNSILSRMIYYPEHLDDGVYYYQGGSGDTEAEARAYIERHRSKPDDRIIEV